MVFDRGKIVELFTALLHSFLPSPFSLSLLPLFFSSPLPHPPPLLFYKFFIQLDSDRVMVFDRGKIIEIDSPTALLHPSSPLPLPPFSLSLLLLSLSLIPPSLLKLFIQLDSDRVMVFDQGKIVEFDSPTALLQNTSSRFAGLVAAARSSIKNP
jgi:hypothetical protein